MINDNLPDFTLQIQSTIAHIESCQAANAAMKANAAIKARKDEVDLAIEEIPGHLDNCRKTGQREFSYVLPRGEIIETMPGQYGFSTDSPWQRMAVTLFCNGFKWYIDGDFLWISF